MTIEHVLPQSLTSEWRAALVRDLAPGESAEEIHRAIVHTLGNLTLTGYNSELSLRPNLPMSCFTDDVARAQPEAILAWFLEITS
ncbi:MAG: HNH endonuclease family protein [Tetrasphaera sp.]